MPSGGFSSTAMRCATRRWHCGVRDLHGGGMGFILEGMLLRGRA